MDNIFETNNDKSNSQARGLRLKIVRKMTGLTRNKLEEKYGISSNTVQSWEAAKAGGIGERGARRVLKALEQEGVFCTADWLLHEKGSPPYATSFCLPQPGKRRSNKLKLAEKEIIKQELLEFRRLNLYSMNMTVSDDGMEPYYKLGDCVAGRVYTGESIKKLIGMDCIVITADHHTLLRRLKISEHKNAYDLVCTNPNSADCKPVLVDQKLTKAAPVIWHRKHDVK